MSTGNLTPLAGGGSTGALKVAIIEPRAETLQHVLTLARQTRGLDVQVLNHAAAYFEVYSGSRGPDVLLVGLDSDPNEALSRAKRIGALAPACGLVVFGHAPTMDLLSQAMAAGARRYLPYPFDGPALLQAVNDVHEEMKPFLISARAALPAHDTPPAHGTPPETGAAAAREPKVVTVFSPKGGVGTSTIAVNLACALSALGRRVALMDGNISFGNAGVFLNLPPSKSILQLVGDPAGISEATVEEALLSHPSGLKVLLAPLEPEAGEMIHGEHLRQIIAVLRARYDYVVVDTWPSYDERVLAMLEVADKILIPTGPELPSIKNLAAFLRVARLLGYPKDKLIPVLMRANSVAPDHLHDIESFLKQPLVWRIVSDGKRVTQSVNNGEPFVLKEETAPVSQNIYALARMLDGHQEMTIVRPLRAKARPFWKRPLFGLGKAS
ncbi:MAG TPA: AAA family ATPase [Chloroflexota bacterium]|nr:AAA family ATPase [Chloroflexota bacterium]